tara:strand:- start:1247 stop:1792 length:546 start_codon:yes stop_codon:yes gene_type:complete
MSPRLSLRSRHAGQLEILCRFTGLINFPHDKLECSFDVGIWDFPDRVVNLTFFDESEGGGVNSTVPQETAGTTYQEYTIQYIETERVTKYYGAFSDSFTNLLFRLHFKRASVRRAPARAAHLVCRRRPRVPAAPVAATSLTVAPRRCRARAGVLRVGDRVQRHPADTRVDGGLLAGRDQLR